MQLLTSLRRYAAFGFAIPGFVRRRCSVEEARALFTARMATREQRFLEMVERCIFAHRASPYLPLLDAAGCEFGDVRKLVEDEGVVLTLIRLRNEGVYFTFEEYKGRQTVNRGSLRFAVRSDDFDNPAASRHYSTQSGGTTGPPTHIWLNLDFRAESASARLLALAAYGLVGVPTAWWRGDLPSAIARRIAEAQYLGVPDRWFAPRVKRGLKDSARSDVAAKLMILAARLGGVRFPRRERLYPEDALTVAQWAQQKLESAGRCVIRAPVSNAVRVAIAASENGIDLRGASIMGGGEPPTPAKVKEIRRSGATWIPNYGFSEVGQVGAGCMDPVDGTDVHFNADRLALIQHPRAVPGTDLLVDAFNFTSLSVNSPKVLLNVESDDFGIFERRTCGCPLGELGLDFHLRDIYSFGKLTGEGATLVGSDMVRILEEVLPSRFGGGPLDYQLVEEEDERSLTRLSLVISPRIQIDDEDLVAKTVLKELESGGGASSMAGKIWFQAGAFKIKRMEPVSTSAGKLLPLHLSRK